MTWQQNEAIELCKQIEQFAPECGCHVALTGGLLYKDGPRKDADIMLYRIRQVDAINTDLLRERLFQIGVHMADDPTPYECTWVIKATHYGKAIDFFFPDVPAQITLEAPAPVDIEEFI